MEKEIILKLKKEQEEKLTNLLKLREETIDAKVAEYRANLEAEESTEIQEVRKIIAGLDEMLCPPVEEVKPVINESDCDKAESEVKIDTTESVETEINATYGRPDSDVKLTMEANEEIPCEEQVAEEIPCNGEVPVEETQAEVEPAIEEPVAKEISIKEMAEQIKTENIKPQNNRNLFNPFNIR